MKVGRRIARASQKTCKTTREDCLALFFRGKRACLLLLFIATDVNKSKRTAVAVLSCLYMLFPGYASGIADSTHVIEEIEVSAHRLSRKVSSVTPTQTIKRETLDAIAARSASDAVRHFAGTQVRDYGGIGGLKTVSVRGLGATHTGLSYDGVIVGNCQAGQIDLGRFATQGLDGISLHIGQVDDLTSTARAIASGSIVSLSSRIPDWKNKPYQLEASLTGGSFGYINPIIHYAHRLSEHTHTNLNLDFSHAQGEYPYQLTNGKQVVSSERVNSDVQHALAEWNLRHSFSHDSYIDTKLYAYASERGLPGAVILYNNTSTERLADRNIFAQMRYSKQWDHHWQLKASAKYTYGWDYYTDTNIKYEGGKQIDENLQQEYYAQATLLYRPTLNWEVSLAQDAFANTLTSNLPSCPNPIRYTSLTALQARYRHERFSLHGILLGTIMEEQARESSAQVSSDFQNTISKITPTISASLRPFDGQYLYLRWMYKHTFRMPTFNDLYYHRSGNRTLRPEQAHEYNAGITWQLQPTKFLNNFTLTLDGYFNEVTDKIVAFPSTYVWKMANYGHVHITGVDATADATLRIASRIRLTATANYTLTHAIDITDPTTQGYRTQLPYTPVHSGSARILFTTPWINIGYSAIFASERYSMSEKIARYRIEGYGEHTLTLSRTFALKGMHFTTQAEAINFTNTQYQIIQYYPMPGRQYRITFKIKI